jgi:myo-inositol-1(or 4)-monophosphatase
MIPDADAVLECAKEAARAAGELLAPQLGRPGGLKMKAAGPVTDADLQAEQAIVRIIRRQFPDHAILSEEMGSEGTGPARWIIDPLDGTSNFIRGIPWYDVSVAFEMDGEVEAGAVFAPSLDLLFTATRGHGAYLQGHPIQVSSVQSLSASLIDLGLMRDEWKNPSVVARVTRLAAAGADIRNLNAAGLDLAFIAAGWLEGFWDLNVSLWDVAAGALLIAEAGGCVLLRSAARGPNGRMTVLASNAGIHAELREILERA